MPRMSERQWKKREQALMDGWKHPIGTRVRVTMDSGEIRETKTRSEAHLLSGSAVIWLEGISGCYSLSRVELAD